jgi:hypothetical protein
MDFIDETISGFGVVLRDETSNIRQIGLSEYFYPNPEKGKNRDPSGRMDCL